MRDLQSYIRNVPDFPKPGVGFKDITPLLKHPEALKEAVMAMCEPYRNMNLDTVVGIESRGFIFGGAMAVHLGAGFVPARKPGKLPAETLQQRYSLEYGTDAVEIHKDAIKNGSHVLVVDDLLATGGTASATVNLVKKLGGKVVGAVFLIELAFLNGRSKLGNIPVHVLIEYDSE